MRTQWPFSHLLVAVLLGSSPALAQPVSSPVFHGETVVPAGGYVAWRVDAGAAVFANGAVLVGQVGSKGARRGPFSLAVLDDEDFQSWRAGYRPDPYYTARSTQQVELHTRLPRSGTYYVVISNPARGTGARAVSGSLQILRAPTSATVASGSVSGRTDANRDLLSFGVVLALAVVLALWSIHDARGREPMEPEKRAA